MYALELWRWSQLDQWLDFRTMQDLLNIEQFIKDNPIKSKLMYQGNCGSFLILFYEFTIGPTTQAVLLIHIKCIRSLPSTASANSSLSLSVKQSQISVRWTSPTKNCTTTNNQVSLSKFNQDLKMRSSHSVGIGELCENVALQTVWKISEVKHYGLRWQIMSFSWSHYMKYFQWWSYTRSSVTKMCLFQHEFFFFFKIVESATPDLTVMEWFCPWPWSWVNCLPLHSGLIWRLTQHNGPLAWPICCTLGCRQLCVM
jgi:hypothetical protein